MIASPIGGVLLAGFALLLVAGILRENITARRMPQSEPLSWERMVSLLRAVKSHELQQIAGCSAHAANDDETHNGGKDLFQAVGGPEGLDRMRYNGMIMAVLARRTREFCIEGDLKTIERIEEQALSLRRKALLVRLLRSFRFARQAKQLYVRDIAQTYCEMVTHLIELYTITHVSRRERLIAACNW